jgi:hypothetical protein
MRFHVRGVDHLCVCGSSVSSKLPEQVFPDATPRPAHKAIIDRCRRSILGRAIAPATAAFQNMHDAADDAAVVRPLDAPYIRRQMRFDPSPLLVAQPKQVPAHNPDPLPTTNQDRIVRAKKLMSSDPRQSFRTKVATCTVVFRRGDWRYLHGCRRTLFRVLRHRTRSSVRPAVEASAAVDLSYAVLSW